MTISSDAYGSTSDVASLTARYANITGVFDATTRPTLATVETQINQVSSFVNTVLANAGFAVPIAHVIAKPALDMFVNEEVSAIVEGINGSGRFGPTTKEPGRSRYRLIMDDLKMFVESNVRGWINLGVPVIAGDAARISAGVINLDFAESFSDADYY